MILVYRQLLQAEELPLKMDVNQQQPSLSYFLWRCHLTLTCRHYLLWVGCYHNYSHLATKSCSPDWTSKFSLCYPVVTNTVPSRLPMCCSEMLNPILQRLLYACCSASLVIRTLINRTLGYPNSQKLVNFHEFYYNLQDGGHLVIWSVFQLPVQLPVYVKVAGNHVNEIHDLLF